MSRKVLREVDAALRRAARDAQWAYLADLCVRRGAPLPREPTRAEAHLIDVLKANGGRARLER